MSNKLSDVIPSEKVSSLVTAWLDEDTPNFDYGGLVVGEALRKAKLLIKSPGVIAGIPFFNAVFNQVDCEVEWSLNEGAYVDSQFPIVVAFVKGKCKDILRGERVALNCICRASGVATIAKSYLCQAKKSGWNGKVAGTRKTTPGFRLVEKYALLVAGADPHRYNLSSMVMLKDNHIWSCGSISNAIESVKNVAGFSVKIEVECGTLEEGLEAAGAGADIVMFDNFHSKELHTAASILKKSFPHILIEASGGIDETNFTAFCGPDVDIISTSKLIQGYPVVDFSLKIIKE